VRARAHTQKIATILKREYVGCQQFVDQIHFLIFFKKETHLRSALCKKDLTIFRISKSQHMAWQQFVRLSCKKAL